jgi:hypothetical protein
MLSKNSMWKFGNMRKGIIDGFCGFYSTARELRFKKSPSWSFHLRIGEHRMISVAEFHTGDQLQSLRLPWTELWLKTKHASFFQSFDWFDSAQKQFAENESMRVFVVSLAGKTIGILPCVLRRSSSRFGTIRRLTNGPVGGAAFSRPIGPNPTATLVACMRHLRQSTRDWDLLDFQQVDVSGIDRGRTRNAMKAVGFRSKMSAVSQSAIVEMNSRWSEYWTTRPKALRMEYGLAEQRLTRLGDVRFVRYRPNRGATDPRWDLFSTVIRTNSRSLFPDSQLKRPSLTSAEQKVISETHLAAVKQGAVDLNVLYVNNRPMATAYNYCSTEGELDSVLFGLTPDAPLDAATILQGLMLRDSFDRGDKRLHFPAGDQQSSAKWSNVLSDQSRLLHYPPLAMRAQLARFGEWLSGTETRKDVASSTVSTASASRHTRLNSRSETQEFKIVS